MAVDERPTTGQLSSSLALVFAAECVIFRLKHEPRSTQRIVDSAGAGSITSTIYGSIRAIVRFEWG